MRMAFLTISVLFILINTSGFCQTHKYFLDDGVVTASQLSSEKYLLELDTKDGVQELQFQYHARENGMYVYDLIKIGEEELSENQKSISSLRTKGNFSDLCDGKPARLFLEILGESEIITLGSASMD